MKRSILLLAALAFGSGACSTTSSPVAPTLEHPTASISGLPGTVRALTTTTNCQPPPDSSVVFTSQLGKVTVTNASPCTNDFTFIVWQVMGDTKINVGQFSRTLAPGQTGDLTLGVQEPCGVWYQRNVFFGIKSNPGQNPFTLSDLSNAKVYAPGGANYPSDSLCATPSPSGSAFTLFTDNFNRADAANLGANWDSGYIGDDPVQIVGNRVRPTTANIAAVETVNAVSLPNNQWAQATISTITGGSLVNLTIVLRAASSPAAETWYEFTAALNGGFYTSRIVKRVAGVGTLLASENGTAWTAGDIIRGQVTGTSLSLYRNGNSTPLVTVTDTALTSGRAGIKVYSATNPAEVQMDDFSAGGL